MRVIILFIVTVLLISCSTAKMYQFTPEYDEAPILTKHISPTFPTTMSDLDTEGEIWLKIQVLKDGTVGEIEIVRSIHQELDDAAVTAVKQWEFTPGKKEDEVIDCWTIFKVELRRN